ncbi:AMP-binding protein [Nocardia aurantia]|uniref:Long-chain-fatty-acid--CoA/3-oxocholest-4-en-26-oate--CoA ligase n=1 Tax=Nocardia aurantia TaxID=2585199 RepID=A0A7K0E0H4_9NOCA|nr:AMP-binding protein [Nocardia aurantia]MQY31559.1 Long-chain-fatty-acid--CoA/3-oxocholest-4-en-26-oate--CoA ligase [Nocardia aurantia]
MPEWTLGAVLDAVAAAVPDRLMTVCGARRTTFAAAAAGTRAFANFLADRGFGAHTPRARLARWECGQDRIALLMRNDRYPEALIGCLKARVIPVNVNHHYTLEEIRDLLAYVRPRGVVYHRSFGPAVAEALGPGGAELLVSVEDGGATADLPGAVSFDAAVESGDPGRVPETSPDDLIMMCTGGTTGRPKGVLWRQGDMYVAAMGGADHPNTEALHEIARRGGQTWFAVSPLLHAAGVWTVLAGALNGHTVVLYDDREPFDAHRTWEIAARERVRMLTIVGDAYAGPLAEQLRRAEYDLSALRSIGTGGAATHSRHRDALFERLPGVAIVDGYGSSETGGMGYGNSRDDARVETFALMPGGAAVSADRRRFLRPGDTETGWAARTGRVPLGYFDDRAATESTFPVIDGVRVAIPGDRATLDPDGNLRLIGRDSLVVNTGGEKVFVEEVETVLRAQDGVADALVVGRASPRWGQEVVALVHARPAAGLTGEALRAACRVRLAGYKVPKAVLFVDGIRRLGNGKPDYRWALARAADAVSLGDPADMVNGTERR